jgi:metal-responsive CopG/Arc/MetJ family transcriptional regulator
MRATDTLTISLPAAMTEQMKRVQKKENRTRSELLREAWRQYFESHYGSYAPTKAELLAIRKGRAEVVQGQYRTLQELLHDLDHPHRKAGRKAARKGSR